MDLHNVKLLFSTFLFRRNVYSLLFKANISLIGGVIYSHFVMKCRSATLKYLYLILVAEVIIFEAYSLTDVFLAHLPLVVTFSLVSKFRQRAWMPWLVFVLNLSYLSYFHLLRALDKNLLQENTGLFIDWLLMMGVITNTSYAWDTHDAHIYSSQVGKRISSNELERLMTVKPEAGFLEFMAYSLTPPGLITGPVVPFYEFRQFTALRKVPDQPGRWRRMSFDLGCSWGMIVGGFILGKFFNEEMIDSDAFRGRPLIFRLGYVYFHGCIGRFKFYSRWMLAEAAYLAMGMGYRKTGDHGEHWNGRETINFWKIETSTSMSDLVANWNMTTNRWLHRYVYRRFQRLLRKHKTSITCNLITFVVSALWHGFFPGYFLFFITMSLFSIIFKGKHCQTIHHGIICSMCTRGQEAARI